jgi:hypothetical protein
VYGLETSLKNTVCSWKNPGSYYIEEASKWGFDTVRIPLSLQYIVETNYNILDLLVSTCKKLGVRFILDFHRVSNNRQEEDPDIGISEYNRINSRVDFLNAVVSIVGRYEKVPEFVGMNSWNEYTGTNITYKKQWDRYIFDGIEATFPKRFVYFSTGLFWGGTLAGFSLEDAPYSDRVIYSVHKYHFSGTGDRKDWESSFGTLYPPSKLIIGEYGFRDPEDMQWGKAFVCYLEEKNIKNHCFWTVAHSGDTGGLWKDDCQTVETAKLGVLKPLLGSTGSHRLINRMW